VSGQKFIAIAGNIGAGKTELTAFLCKKYGLKPFYEPNDQNPYLADFYKDMKTWAFRSQIFFLTHKFKLHRELERQSGTSLQDRTIYEDAEIFAKNLYRQRFIDKRDWQTYWELYENVAAALKPPDLMIYLRCPVKTLKQRIRLRGARQPRRRLRRPGPRPHELTPFSVPHAGADVLGPRRIPRQRGQSARHRARQPTRRLPIPAQALQRRTHEE
jgi:thymidylate kinase